MLISISFSVVIYRFSTSEINRVLRMEQLRKEGQYIPGKRVVVPFDFNDPTQKMIMLGQPNTEVLEEAKERILYALIAINLAILGLAGLAGFLLAGLTLKPIKKMVDEQNRFITDASHELRTPLTSLKSEIEVNLRDKNLTLADAKKLLQSNLEEVNSLQYLSDNLIKLAQNKQQNSAKIETVSIPDISISALKKVEKLAKKKEIKINTEIEDIKVEGEKQSLTELLVIFLDNAIKYSNKNSEINLSAKKSGKNALIEIKDQGAGIDKKDLPMLFERFYRSDKARSADGFGLGLSIAKQIVDKHNGSVNVKSQINKGTTFTIKFPLSS